MLLTPQIMAAAAAAASNNNNMNMNMNMMSMTELSGSAPTLNIVLLGDGATGKSSIASRFQNGVCPKSYKPTQGLDFYKKSLPIPNEEPVTIKIWDVCGQMLTNRTSANYLCSAHAIFLVYDISHTGSFQNLEEWLKLIYSTYLGTPYPVELSSRDPRLPYLVLVGNKCDLSTMRTVQVDKHYQFALDHNLASFFTSCKTGEGVANLVMQTTLFLVRKADDMIDDENMSSNNQENIDMVLAELSSGNGQSSGQENASKCLIM